MDLLNDKDVVTWEACETDSCCPPVSVFDSKQGYWQKRKREWKSIGLRGEIGRDDELLGSGMKKLAESRGMNLTGTSIFDPVLCEVVYQWFSPGGGVVFDPFAGGPVRGVVAEMAGRKYIGIDLSERQVDANRSNADELGVCPAWYCDDSRNADEYIQDGTADLVFSCPPYHNLEKYSSHPLDLSNMNYQDFLEAYSEIIATACRKLKDGRFAVFVVGDIRDSKGAYRDFLGATKRIFKEAGLSLYNECILLEQYGTAPMRAGKVFAAGRKLVKVHQNVLIFYKGDPRKIKETFTQDHFEPIDLEAYHGRDERKDSEVLPRE